MERERFVKVVEEVPDSLPEEFRSSIPNVAVLVEDLPPSQPTPPPGQRKRLLLGLFHGCLLRKKRVWPCRNDLTTYLAKNPGLMAQVVVSLLEQRL